jgi:hypothetical protein
VHIPVVDVPAFLAGVSRSAAGELGHSPPTIARNRLSGRAIGMVCQTKQRRRWMSSNVGRPPYQKGLFFDPNHVGVLRDVAADSSSW